MDKKIIVGFVVGAIIFGAGGYYVGMTYGAGSKGARSGAIFTRGMMGNTTVGTRAGSGGFSTGTILSKDATSITIKLRAGGSQIVFLSGSTEVMKTVTGASSDLVVGQDVVASGTINSDGSITASSVQIRPAGAAPFMGGNGGRMMQASTSPTH